MRKDKKQVIGDEIGDEQIKLFLDFRASRRHFAVAAQVNQGLPWSAHR